MSQRRRITLSNEANTSFLKPSFLISFQKSRGVLDVYLFCTDGLCGMMEAIQAVYPKSRLQRRIVHHIRSSTHFVSWKDIKQVAADLKKIYTAVTLDEAENALLQFGEKWRKQYPSCVKSWEENWDMVLSQLQIMFADRAVG